MTSYKTRLQTAHALYFCALDSNLRREMSPDSSQLCLCWLLNPRRFLLILLPAGKSQSIPAGLHFFFFLLCLWRKACYLSFRALQTLRPCHLSQLLCAKRPTNYEQRNDFLPSPLSQTSDHPSQTVNLSGSDWLQPFSQTQAVTAVHRI